MNAIPLKKGGALVQSRCFGGSIRNKIGFMAVVFGLFSAGSALSQTVKSGLDCVDRDGTEYRDTTRWSADKVVGSKIRNGSMVGLAFTLCEAPSQLLVTNPNRTNSSISAVKIIEAAVQSRSRMTLGDLRSQLNENGYQVQLLGFDATSCLCAPDARQRLQVPEAATSGTPDEATIQRLTRYLLGSGNF